MCLVTGREKQVRFFILFQPDSYSTSSIVVGSRNQQRKNQKGTKHLDEWPHLINANIIVTTGK